MPILDLKDEIKVAEYENFIRTSEYGDFMQSINWAKVKSNWDRDYVYLEDENGKISAAMSIISISNDGESSFMYCPKGPVCDFNDPQVVKKLLDEATPVIEMRNGFVLRMDPEFERKEDFFEKYTKANIENAIIYSEPQDENKFSNPYMRMKIDLNYENIEEYKLEFDSKFRNKINRTYKKNFETKKIRKDDEGFEEALDSLFELIKTVAERQGITYRPKKYFENIFKAFPQNATLYQFIHEGDLLSSCIIINYNKKSMYLYSGSADIKRNLNSNVYMIIETIKDAIEAGLSEYDMGGIKKQDDSDGLYQFKRKFTRPENEVTFATQIDVVFDENKYQSFIK